MKLKKALSGILAAAMVVTMVPSMVFATTTNTVVKTYTVATDEDMPVVAVDLEIKNSDGILKDTAEKFKVKLTNAEWAVDEADEMNLVATSSGLSKAYPLGDAVTEAGIEVGKVVDGTYTDLSSEVEVDAVDDDVATVTFTPGANIGKGSFVRVYLALHALDEGEVQVSIDGGDSDISSSTLTVATATGSTTVAEVTGTVKTYPRQTVTGAKVEISETSVNTITGDQIIKLTLPSNYTWSSVKVSGDLANSEQDFSGAGVTSIGAIATAGTDWYIDGRTAYVYVDIKPLAGVTQDLTIEPTFVIGKDATMGDVTLSIAGYKADAGDKISGSSGLVVAKYGDEYVTVSTVAESDLPQVIAGYQQDSDDDYFVAEVTIKEGVKGSLTAGRYIDFDFNDEIAIVAGAPVKYYVGTGSSEYSKATEFTTTAPLDEASIDVETDKTKDCSEMTITVPSSTNGIKGWSTNKANTLTLYIPITAKANYTGDIKLNVSGAKAGIEETDLVVGKVIAPVSVETNVTDVINGAQGQALANIKITENVPGYIESSDVIKLSLDTLNIEGGYTFKPSGCKATVTDGDLELKAGDIVKDNGKNISLTVKNPSVKASTIEVTGVVVNMARNLPSGEYNLKVEVSNIDNAAYDNGNFKQKVDSPAYVNITTAAENTTDSFTAQFVIGEASYTNNGTATEMDAAAYIDSHNRTMVPIRYVANACGISENDIRWEQNTQTAIINGLNTVVTVKMGSNKLQTSTGEITMDTVAVNNNGRIYVPVRYIANALGANVSWDAATKTVTLTK